jgi:hypothetical protein
VLFEDNFDTGLKPDWEVVAGDWRIANGALTTLTYDGWSYILVGDPSWAEYAVELDVSYGGWCTIASVFITAKDFHNMIMWETAPCGDTALYVKQDGKVKRLVTGGRVQADRTRLRLEVREGFYIGYVNNQQVFSINDPTFKQGRAGLAIECEGQCNRIDNFRVVALDN